MSSCSCTSRAWNCDKLVNAPRSCRVTSAAIAASSAISAASAASTSSLLSSGSAAAAAARSRSAAASASAAAAACAAARARCCEGSKRDMMGVGEGADDILALVTHSAQRVSEPHSSALRVRSSSLRLCESAAGQATLSSVRPATAAHSASRCMLCAEHTASETLAAGRRALLR